MLFFRSHFFGNCNMFTFFRRYQRFFFIIVTVVVVLSFSFFGTYSTFMGPKEDNSVVFVGIDGSKVRRSEFMDYSQFLSSEAQDLYGLGQGHFNPANDGFITNQILAAGFGEEIWNQMKSGHEPLTDSLDHERGYVPYAHPQMPFLGLEGVWTYFSPDLSTAYRNYRQKISEQSPEDLFKAKAALYTAQKQFPPVLARQVMLYQLAQMGVNQNIEANRLAIFGYDSIQEWFGKPFLDACVVWVYNTARIAEKEGVVVSDREALFAMLKACQDLLNREAALKQMGYESPGQLLIESLRRIGLDEAGGVRVMKDVLLSRKLFEQVGTATPIAPLVFDSLVHTANTFVRVNNYELPDELHVKTADQLYLIQLWIDAVRKGTKGSGWEAQLALPTETQTPDELSKSYPQLVQRRFHVQYASVDAHDLADALPLREVWAWQTSDSGWKKLQSTYPELKGNVESSHRLHNIDALPKEKREEVDAFSRATLIQESPQRIEEALSKAEMKPAQLSIRLKGSTLPFQGISDYLALKQLLSGATVGEQDDKLKMYSQDGRNYLRIIVQDRIAYDEVVPLNQALSDKTLDTMLNETLQTAYVRIRSQNPKNFLQDNGEWKPLDAVRSEIIEKHFQPLINALDQAREVYKPLFPELCNWEQVKEARLAVRFMPYVKSVWEKVQKDPGMISQYVEESPATSGFNQVVAGTRLFWKLHTQPLQVVRKEGSSLFIFKNLENLTAGNWIPPYYNATHGLSFSSIIEKGVQSTQSDLTEKVMGMFQLVGNEAQHAYASKLIAQMDFTVLK